MKTTQIEKMRKQAETLSVFGNASSVSTIKKSMYLDSTLAKIDNLTTNDVVDCVLSTYKPIFALLPKEIRGIAKKQFCDAVRLVCSQNGTLFALDNNGNVVPRRVVAKIKKSDNTELWQLLSNLVADAAKETIDAADAADAAAAADAANDCYFDALLDCALLAA